jgi:hypothetical protein
MLASYKEQGEFLENTLNLILFKNSSKNIVKKISDSEYLVINGIISIVFSNSTYVTQMDIIVKLSDKLLNFSVMYNEVEESFESYYSLNSLPKKRVRYNFSYETKSIFIQNRYSLFFSRK